MRERRERQREAFDIEMWKPKTVLGKAVKSKEAADLKAIIEKGKKIIEPEIIDALMPGYDTDFINLGQAKGKFGGGKRRAIKQTQKKTKEGSALHFTALDIIGNKNGYVGVGAGSSTETVPAREKALKKAKTNLMEVARGCGSWECTCGEPHSLPFKVSGKSGSVEIELLPAPRGVGLAVDNELRKILSLAGYKDLWSKINGQTRHKMNTVNACLDALRKAVKHRVLTSDRVKLIYGAKG